MVGHHGGVRPERPGAEGVLRPAGPLCTVSGDPSGRERQEQGRCAGGVHPGAAAELTRLKGVGSNDAIMLETEVLWRGFRNRREIAAWAGLAPMPRASGPVDRQQGISKAGNAKVRKDLIQLAWRWVRWQPESDIAVWFREYCAARDGRSRKRGIVAVARKLLVALRLRRHRPGSRRRGPVAGGLRAAAGRSPAAGEEAGNRIIPRRPDGAAEESRAGACSLSGWVRRRRRHR